MQHPLFSHVIHISLASMEGLANLMKQNLRLFMVRIYKARVSMPWRWVSKFYLVLLCLCLGNLLHFLETHPEQGLPFGVGPPCPFLFAFIVFATGLHKCRPRLSEWRAGQGGNKLETSLKIPSLSFLVVPLTRETPKWVRLGYGEWWSKEVVKRYCSDACPAVNKANNWSPHLASVMAAHNFLPRKLGGRMVEQHESN